MQLKFDKYESFLVKAGRKLEELQEYHKQIEEVSLAEIRNLADAKTMIYDYLKERKLALRTFDAPRPKPKPIINNNGKRKCDICSKEFSTKGFPSHYKKCQRLQAEEARIEQLKAELVSDLEGDE